MMFKFLPKIILGFSIFFVACQKPEQLKLNSLDSIFDEASSEWVNCAFYQPKNEQHQHPDYGNKCGQIDKNGLVRFTPEFMNLELYFREEALACTALSKSTETVRKAFLGWFHITPTGYGRGHKEYGDNDCAYLKDLENGLLKTYVNGKLAYVDQNLNIIHQTEFPFGNYLYQSKAIICSKRPTRKWGPHFEHFVWAGGICGEIDSSFNIITPINKPYEYFHPLPPWVYEGYMLETRIQTQPGKGDALKSLIEAGTKNMPGNRVYKIYKFGSAPDELLIHEEWDHRDDHLTSLKLESVRKAMQQGRHFITSIERVREHEHYNSDTSKP